MCSSLAAAFLVALVAGIQDPAPTTSDAPEAVGKTLPAFWAGYEGEVSRELSSLEEGTEGADVTLSEPGGGEQRLFKTVGKGMFSATLTTVYALCLVVALILLTAYIVPRLSPYLSRLVGRRRPFLTGPELATVLGRVQLAPNVALHFVDVGGQVLLVGVTQSTVTLLKEFDAAAFEQERNEQAESTQERVSDTFLTELKARARNMNEGEVAAGITDADIASLRSEIQRLKEYLQEAPSETSR